MATVGAAVGLGNIWAFPYKMGANGGFAFLIIYLCLAVLIDFTIMLSELSIGHKVGMPALFIMLVIVICRAVTLPGAAEGLKFMVAPNFAPLKENFLGVLSAAGGQMFFSLPLAMGITVTYGSYLNKRESLVKNSLLIIVSDTLVAIMAGMAVLPAAFALGGDSAELAGPKLLFITLQDVFNAMGPAGPVFGVLFYGLVTLAAITGKGGGPGLSGRHG